MRQQQQQFKDTQMKCQPPLQQPLQAGALQGKQRVAGTENYPKYFRRCHR